MKLLDRFFKKVRKTPYCWEWVAAIDRLGYGQFWVKDSMTTAHRVSYEITHGSVPAGLVLDHICRNRKCVNPGHLRAVTQKENVLCGQGNAALNARKTYCIRGHEFTETNTIRKRNGRNCRTCSNEWNRRKRLNTWK